MQMVFIDQRSPEWFALREKRMTASHAQAIGANGKGLTTYIMELMQDYFSSAEKESFSNAHTERGNELEDEAGFMYEMQSKVETVKVGFVIYDENVGCSPDLFAGTDGIVEIKCPADKAYFEMLINGTVDSKYIWQMQMQMLICEKAWCDFVAYNPNYNQSLIIKRFYPDPEKQEKLLAGFFTGRHLMSEIERKYRTVK